VQHRDLVVVFEDDPHLRPLLERWLGEAGYSVTPQFPDGDTRPVLVIADVRDPQGADVPIRALQEYRVAILVMSARFRRGLAGSAETARRLGVQAVLPKPFTRAELLTAVRDAIAGTE